MFRLQIRYVQISDLEFGPCMARLRTIMIRVRTMLWLVYELCIFSVRNMHVYCLVSGLCMFSVRKILCLVYVLCMFIVRTMHIQCTE